MISPTIAVLICRLRVWLSLLQRLYLPSAVVGLGLCGFVLMPFFGVHPAFGNLLELGFEGGHGTVGGMSQAFLAKD